MIMSRQLYIPEGYKSALSLRETQHAIKFIKDTFQQALSFALTLDRVTAPLIVRSGSGINDDLNGVERKVGFDLLEDTANVEVVQSLAKWKRMALYRYGYNVGEGIFTDMNAIRRDDNMDNVHSIYVDQWDWEKVIEAKDRNLDYLKGTVMDIAAAVSETQRTMRAIYPQLQALPELERCVTFITAQDLEDRWPELTPKQREHAFLKEHKTAFVGSHRCAGCQKRGCRRTVCVPDQPVQNRRAYRRTDLRCRAEIHTGIIVHTVPYRIPDPDLAVLRKHFFSEIHISEFLLQHTVLIQGADCGAGRQPVPGNGETADIAVFFSLSHMLIPKDDTRIGT